MKQDEMHHCPKCTWLLERVWSKKKDRYFWFCIQPNKKPDGTPVCGAVFSDEDGYPMIYPSIKKSEPDPSVICPSCKAPMRLVQGGKFGDFWSCSSRETTGCKGTIDVLDPAHPHKLPPVCPEHPEHGHMRLRAGRNGRFLGCRKYPDCCATLELDGSSSKPLRSA